MIPLGMIGAWLGYSVMSWGWILTKGYNITFREWVTPLNAFDWSAGVKYTPCGQVFPKKGVGDDTKPDCSSSTSSSGGGGGGGSTAPGPIAPPAPVLPPVI